MTYRSPRQQLHSEAVQIVARRLRPRGFDVACTGRSSAAPLPGDLMVNLTLWVAVRAGRPGRLRAQLVRCGAGRRRYEYRHVLFNLRTHNKPPRVPPAVWVLLRLDTGEAFVVPAALLGNRPTVNLMADHRRARRSWVYRYQNRWETIAELVARRAAA